MSDLTKLATKLIELHAELDNPELEQAAAILESFSAAEKTTGKHIDGVWCENLRCKVCYTQDAWLTQKCDELSAALAEAQKDAEELQRIRLTIARSDAQPIPVWNDAFFDEGFIRKLVGDPR